MRNVHVLHLPAFLAADIVYRFGLSRCSSEISFESGGDNKSVSVASLEITFCCTSVEERNCVVVLGRSDDVVVCLIGADTVAGDDNDEENGLCCDGKLETVVNEIGFWVVVRRVVDDVVAIVGFVE